MKDVLQTEMAGLLGVYRQGGSVILLFDFDGTIAPFAEHPRLARLPPGTRDLLATLAARPRMFVGIISSRELKELKGLVALPDLYYSGTNGLEFDLRGVGLTHPKVESLSPSLDALAVRLEGELRGFPRAWVEMKRYSLTVHYRGVAEEKIPSLRGNVSLILEPFRNDLRLLDGAMAIDIAPVTGWTKGFAVRTIFERAAGSAGGLLYAGDEANDADAFETASDLGGITIGIGPRAPSNARHRLPDPPALIGVLSDFLRDMDRECGSCPEGS